SDLLPADVETLRRDPRHGPGYRESPRLSTHMVGFNVRGSIFGDLRLRRSLAQAIDVAGTVRRTLGRLAIPAHGLIPPGLLGYAPGHARERQSPGPNVAAESVNYTVSKETREVTAAVHPTYFGEYAALLKELSEAFREMGFVIRPINT